MLDALFDAFLYRIHFCHQIITVYLDAFVVFHAVFLAQGSDVHNLFQFLEDSVAGLEGFHIFQYIYPAFKIILAFTLFFVEQGELQENEAKFVRELRMRVMVFQPDIGAQFLFDVFLAEVHEEDAIDGFQVELPLGTSFALPGDGTCEVVNGSFAEECLLSVLHFHDEVFAAFIGAVDVVDAIAVFDGCALDFLVQKADVANVLLARKEAVEEINQQFFVDFLSEDAFEADIGERVDELGHGGFIFSSSRKDRDYLDTLVTFAWIFLHFHPLPGCESVFRVRQTGIHIPPGFP